jgi:hypothetical protein
MLAAGLLRAPTVIAPSRLNNRYRPVLDQAKATSVLIHESDDENLMILRASIVDELVLASEHTANFAQFLLATANGTTRGSVDALGRLAWMSDLSDESFASFAPRYGRAFAESVLRSDWSRLEQFLDRWQEAAEIESSPELVALLAEDVDSEQFVDIARPA